MPITVVDSHHHFWSPKGGNYKWLGPVSEGGASWHVAGDIERFKHDYLLDNYLQDIKSSNFQVIKSVHVQAEADDPLVEVAFLEEIAASSNNPGGFPHGIVAHANLASPNLTNLLDTYTRDHPRVKGIRQLLNWSKTDARLSMTDRGDYLTDDTWLQGFSLLAPHSLSFDFHVYPHQMIDGGQVARRHPNTTIILDHCGLPLDGKDDFAGWKEGIGHMAAQSNVVCKLSGLVMFDHAWTRESLAPYILECVRAFGPKRCMFGSNFPVDKLNITYEQVVSTYYDIAQKDGGLSADELERVFMQNAIDTYRL